MRLLLLALLVLLVLVVVVVVLLLLVLALLALLAPLPQQQQQLLLRKREQETARCGCSRGCSLGRRLLIVRLVSARGGTRAEKRDRAAHRSLLSR